MTLALLLDPNLFEGDMILRPDQIARWKNGELGYGSKKNRNELWPNGVVPYTISYELRKFLNCLAPYIRLICLTYVNRIFG